MLCHSSSIRLASAEDVADLQAIYAYYVAKTTFSFEYAIPTIAEYSKRISEIRKDFPVLVYSENGRTVGFAYAHRYSTREAYLWTVETTVYIAPDCVGKGIGSSLYGALFRVLKALGYKTLLAVVTEENLVSCQFHRKCGFREIGAFHRSGYKFSRWLNTVLFEYSLDCSRDTEPARPKSISNLSFTSIEDLLKDERLL